MFAESSKVGLFLNSVHSAHFIYVHRVANQQQELSKRSQLSKHFQLSKRFYSCISAFLFLHKRFCFISYMSQHLYIFSDCESARYFTFFSKLSYSYYFNFLMWSAYLLISVVRFLMTMCIDTNINFVQNF